MPNVFKYNPSSTEAKSLRKGNFYIGVGDVGKGPTNETGFWNGLTVGTFSYVIVLHRGENVPTFYQIQNDTELIERTNQIDKSVVRTTKEQCFSYFSGQSDKIVLNKEYEPIVTDGLVLNLDARFLPSYPGTGSSWYDLSVSGNTGTLNNGPTFNSSGYFVFDGADDSVSRTYNSTFDIRSGITLCALFRRNSIFTQLSDCFILSRPPAWYFYDEYGSGAIRGDVFIDGTRRGNRSVSMPNDGRWYEFVYTYDSSTGWAIMYRNGASASSTQVTGLSNYLIDSSNANFQSIFFNQVGKSYFVNNLKIYNRALSASEIQQNYYGGPIVTDGLTFSIDASSFISYDRISATWSNMVGTTVNGTLTNSPTFNLHYGGGFKFDGTNQFVTYGNHTPYGFTSGVFSVCVWVNIPSSWTGGSQYPNLISKGASAGWDTNGWAVFAFRNYGSGNGFTLGYGMRNSTTTKSAQINNIPTDIPVHFCVTIDGSNIRAYLDGTLRTTESQTINPASNTDSFIIARGPSTGYFPGTVYMSQIYTRSLTPSEILQNFNAHRSRFGI